MPAGRTVTILLAVLVITVTSWADTDTPTASDIRRMGLEARLDHEIRDSRLQELAAAVTDLGPKGVLPLQGDFQFAFLLHCDPEIYQSLSPDTIEAIDNSLETLFNYEDIERDNTWEALVYVYGFFNHDVTPALIREVLTRWDELSDEEKGPRYPTYIHVIDAVCKPLSVGPLENAESTTAALELVILAMKQAFLATPKPGTAFHPPSHACLVLGPLYERWIDDETYGPVVKKHLGDRASFEAMMGSRLTGGLQSGDPESHVAYGYYAYIGSYLANAIARLNARSTVPALLNSLKVYEKHGSEGRVANYTQRALLALGETDARNVYESNLADPSKRDECMTLAVWLARNGQGETRIYGLEKLGQLLGCEAATALDTYFVTERDSLK